MWLASRAGDFSVADPSDQKIPLDGSKSATEGVLSPFGRSLVRAVPAEVSDALGSTDTLQCNIGA